MFSLEYIRLAWESVRSHKVRAALTLLGMVIGVFAIIVAVTAVKVIETSFSDTIRSFGSTTFTVSRGNSAQREGTNYRPRPNLTYDQALQLIERAEMPVAISPTQSVSYRVEARYLDRKTEPAVTFQGSNEHWAGNFNFEIAEGRFLTEQDVRLGRPVVVIGHDLADELFPTETALGKDMLVDGNRYQVIGVFAEKGDAFGENPDMISIIPITRMISLYSTGTWNVGIRVRARSLEVLAATMDDVTGHLRVIRRNLPGEDNDFEVTSNESFVSEVETFTSRLSAGGAAIGLITLLAAGIGIMNIMLVSVTERTREIGIRKAVGARRQDILRQFLYEAVFLCQVGGIVGIMVGAVAGNVVGFFFDSPFVFPWFWAFLAVIAVSAIALTFGVYPAFKAAGLDPIESLRYE